jgi:hypothetical protein
MMSDFYVNYSPVTFQNIDERDQEFIVDPNRTLIQNIKKGSTKGDHSVFCYHSEWLNKWFDDGKTGKGTSQIIKGVQQPFDVWKEIDIDHGSISNDAHRDQEYFHEIDYPSGVLTNLITKYILEPTGTKEVTAAVFRKISHSKFIRRLSGIRK